MKGSSSAVPRDQKEKLWQEFFSDPYQWWDHRAEKLMALQSSHVNGAMALVGFNLAAFSWLLSCHSLNFGKKMCLAPLHWCGQCSWVEKLNKGNMLMGKG
jgi:hypothetical protein